MIAKGSGAAEALIALQNTEAEKYVEKLINIAPCAIYNQDYEFFPQPPPQARRREL